MQRSYLKLNTSVQLKDGTYTIYIGVGYGTSIYISTGISATEDDWDERSQTYVGKGAKGINDTLATMVSRVNLQMREWKISGKLATLSKNELKTMLKTGRPTTPEKSNNIGPFFEKVTATKNKRTSELYSQTLVKLRRYTEVDNQSFDVINRLWLDSFYRSMDPLSANAKAIHMRNLRHVVNYAIDEDIIQRYPFRNYHIPTEDTAMRVLTIDKLRQLLSYNHLYERDREYRDIFMLMFYLIGINIVDLGGLTKEDVVNGRIEYRRAKTGKFYSIKIEPEAATILKRYKGKHYLLRCFERYESYRGYMVLMNKGLRKIGAEKLNKKGKPIKTKNHLPIMEPLEPTLTTYWARYTWATIAAELDIPKDTISEALGHSHGARVTGVYIKYNRDKVDEANRKVIDYVLYNKV